ncbi:hypothetical protein QR680_007789 [Steinernema hermaphroditum]|uniref:ShKT domain-containing protein n=1 Tax=Steinernema hermaphroditum TaxID=289476 RepID=A0AA39M6I3_9BILA|nr:hypothetical protein QR680_007789 [Steinernema hermaphroditum]
MRPLTVVFLLCLLPLQTATSDIDYGRLISYIQERQCYAKADSSVQCSEDFYEFICVFHCLCCLKEAPATEMPSTEVPTPAEDGQGAAEGEQGAAEGGKQ